MSLLDSLHDKYHHCAMDNLYNLAHFCKRTYNHGNRVLCHGVYWEGRRGLPSSVIQEEKKTRVVQITVRETIKTAVLKGDVDCTDLVTSSVYNAKDVHYLSMLMEKLQWKAPVYTTTTNFLPNSSASKKNDTLRKIFPPRAH